MKHARTMGLGWITVAALAAGLLWPASVSQAQPLKPHDVKALRQPQFDIDYQLGDSRATEVELWYTDDKSQSWQLYGVEPGRKSPISFTAKHEGLFGFMVIARNKAGASANAPTPGTEPMFWCYVVWRRPQVLITGPTPAAADAVGPGQVGLKPGEPLIITYSAVSDHLTETPIRIEYRLANDQQWKDIAVNQANSGKFAWTVPDAVQGPFLLRVTAVDLAGNVSPATSLREIEITRDEPRVHVAGNPAKGGTESGTTIEPGLMPTMTRQPPQPVAELPASMPDAIDVVSALNKPILPEAPPKYNEPTIPAPPPGTGTVVAPSIPKAGPAGVPDRGMEPSGESTASAMDAVGMLVVKYTAPEPVSAEKLEPAVVRLKASLRPLVDRGMLLAPIGVSRQPAENSANLVKVVQLYAVIPSAQRKRAGDIERDAYESVTAAMKEGKLEGVMITSFDRAEPTGDTAVAAVGTGAAGTPTSGAGGTVALANTTPKVNTPATPDIREETVAPIVQSPIDTSGVGMVKPDGIGGPGPTSRPAQPTVDDPSLAAGGRENIALQFGPRQHDLTIKSPPPVEPAPAPGSGIVTEAPALVASTPTVEPIAPAPLPLKEPVTAPTTVAQLPKVDLGSITPAPAATPAPLPAPATGPLGTPPTGLPTEGASVATAGRIRTPEVTTPGPTPVAPVVTGPVGPAAPIEPPAAAKNTATPSGLGGEKVAPGTPSVTVTTIRSHIDADLLLAAQKAFRDGGAALAANDRARAAACYKDAIDNDPEMVEAYINLAGLQIMAQQYDQAELNYQRAVNIQPDHVKALFGLGSVQYLRKNPQMARETLGKLLRIRGTYPEAWVLYGDASFAVRDTPSAISAWKEAIRLAPGTAIAKVAQEHLTRFGGAGN